MLASRRGHLEGVKLLCEAGADKDKADQNGRTALMVASRRGDLEVVQLLCEAGADKDKAKENGARKGTNEVSTNGVTAIVCFLTEGPFGYYRKPTSIFPKVPGLTFFPNLSNSLLLQRPHLSATKVPQP